MNSNDELNPRWMVAGICLAYVVLGLWMLSASVNIPYLISGHAPLTPTLVLRSNTASTASPFVEEIVTHYSGMIRLTDSPIALSPAMLVMCDAPRPGLDAPLHASRFNVYVNPIGQAAMAESGERTFPTGSVIIKEKLIQLRDAVDKERLLWQGEHVTPTTSDLMTSLGIMIKREPGFNPAGGDWEYAYWEEGVLYRTSEAVAQCQACHVSGIVPVDWEEKYATYGVYLGREARDAVFMTLPDPNN